jgi:hypothetical protein
MNRSGSCQSGLFTGSLAEIVSEIPRQQFMNNLPGGTFSPLGNACQPLHAQPAERHFPVPKLTAVAGSAHNVKTISGEYAKLYGLAPDHPALTWEWLS